MSNKHMKSSLLIIREIRKKKNTMSKIPLHAHQEAKFKKIDNNVLPRRMWRNQHPPTV